MIKSNKMPKILQNYPKPLGFSDSQFMQLQNMCGARFIDLFLHLPTNFIPHEFSTIDGAENFENVIIKAKVISANTPYSKKPIPGRPARKIPWKFELEDESGVLELVYFNNAPWLKSQLSVGSIVIVSGKIELKNGKYLCAHPTLFSGNKNINELLESSASYPLTAGLTQKMVSGAIDRAIKLFENEVIDEWLPKNVIDEYNLPTFLQSLKIVHKPKNEEELISSPALARLAFDELFAHQIALSVARQNFKDKPCLKHKNKNILRKSFLDNLSFNLTEDQSKSVVDIDTNLQSKTPMLRLLQGDVGSGKTVVAFLAAINAVESGYQAAIMAPTEILATQHYENALEAFTPLKIQIALLTGKTKAAEKTRIKKALKRGDIDIIIGTHALINTDDFKALSLVVIDEQHRFGVKQRLALTQKSPVPHLLLMSATPIPRTLALTAYGDMDISIIKQKPAGRLPIKTSLSASSKIPEIANSLSRIFEKGEQVYWVCPLVEESEKSDLTAAKERFEDLSKLYPNEVGLIHGKMKPSEKEESMLKFKNGEFKLLVATTVIEVGVDVKAATVIIIEHAERFGLAALHQLRGRVGRNSVQSHCILIYSKLNDIAKERLGALRKSDDGFYIAEQDLKLRGHGEVLGTSQAGYQSNRIFNIQKHAKLLPITQKLAQQTVQNPPQNQSDRRALAILLHIFDKYYAIEYIQAG